MNTPNQDLSGLLREADPKEVLEAMKEAYRSEHQEVLRLREKVRTQSIAFAEWIKEAGYSRYATGRLWYDTTDPVRKAITSAELYEVFKTTTS